MYLDILSTLWPLLVRADDDLTNDDENKSPAIGDDTLLRQKYKTVDVSEKVKKREPFKVENSTKHFFLSLLEDFDAIPKNVKVDAKHEILSILRKFKKSDPCNLTDSPVLTPSYKHQDFLVSRPAKLLDSVVGDFEN